MSPDSAVSAANDLGVIGVLAVVILLLVFGLVYVIKTYAVAKVAASESAAANAAVNNTGPGEHRLYDKLTTLAAEVAHLREAQEDFAERGWRALPDDIATGAGLTVTIRDLQHGHQATRQDIVEVRRALETVVKRTTEISSTLRTHDAWERSVKHAGEETLG